MVNFPLKLAKINLGNMLVHSSDEDATVFVNPSSVCSDSSLDEVSDSKWGGGVCTWEREVILN